MSGGQSCTCTERHEPITPAPGSNRPGRLWRVRDRLCNYSAFNGYRRTPSRYSSIKCLRCGCSWRTTAKFVAELADIDPSENEISHGYEGHAEAMAARGRTPFGMGGK